MSHRAITYQVEDRIATITLNRPERLNAFTLEMGREMAAAFDAADADDAVRAVIVTGAGRGFCAGMELEPEGEAGGENVFGLAVADDPEADPERLRDAGGRLTLRIFESTKPVIAAINGAAVGIGITMTLPMDFRIAADTAKLGFVFARRGIVTEACSRWFLPRVVGMSQAFARVMTGRVFTADEALRGGLVRTVVPASSVLDEARKLAREIADNTSPVSVALARQMLWRLSAADHPMAAHEIDSRAMYHTSMGPDAKEGIASFLEKRAPAFTTSPARDMPPFYPWWPERKFR